MARIPLPATLFFASGHLFDDAASPGTPSPLTPNVASAPTQWLVGAQSGVGDAQLTEVAQAIEELIQQDLVGTSHENKTIGINALGGRPAFDVSMVVSGDTETNITVGAQAPFTINKAASLAALIRSIPGHGTTYIPS